MYQTEQQIDDAELEALTFVPGTCTECNRADHVYHDGSEALCLDCLEGVVREEADAADREAADYWRIENARLAQEAARPQFAPCADYPF